MLGSGSSGNAVLVESHGTRVLVDAGIGPQKASDRLASLGAELLPRGVDAIVATHEHGDHFGQIEKLARAFRCPVFLHGGIEGLRVRKRFACTEYQIGRSFRVGELEIETEIIPHDAPQVAVRVASPDHALGIAVDVGHVTEKLVSLLATCDAAIVEANHCPELLAWGPYPERLKRRLSGGLGHLSNRRCAELAAQLVGSRLGRLWLGHLSSTNNTPERAFETVAEQARRIEVGVLPHGTPLRLDVRRVRPVQLGLPF